MIGNGTELIIFCKTFNGYIRSKTSHFQLTFEISKWAICNYILQNIYASFVKLPSTLHAHTHIHKCVHPYVLSNLHIKIYAVHNIIYVSYAKYFTVPMNERYSKSCSRGKQPDICPELINYRCKQSVISKYTLRSRIFDCYCDRESITHFQLLLFYPFIKLLVNMRSWISKGYFFIFD